MSLKSTVAAGTAALIIMVSPAVAGGPIAGSEGAEGARYAAIQRCNAEARKHYRGIYYSWGDVRDFAYKHCLFDAGFPE